MRTRWQLALLAAVAALGLQGCDPSPPQTTVQPPQASLPDDTVLPGSEGAPPQVAATPPQAQPATPPAQPQTNAMGAPGAPAPSAQVPGGQGTATMTEMWQWQGGQAGASSGAAAAPPAAAT
ncbi:MAG TPA: hypothetical protein VFM98_18425, partial [Ramlibacter sp.]|nr:hypothetical protein [Ramlibacter sp.]